MNFFYLLITLQKVLQFCEGRYSYDLNDFSQSKEHTFFFFLHNQVRDKKLKFGIMLSNRMSSYFPLANNKILSITEENIIRIDKIKKVCEERRYF
jgi:hypothetical protein